MHKPTSKIIAIIFLLSGIGLPKTTAATAINLTPLAVDWKSPISIDYVRLNAGCAVNTTDQLVITANYLMLPANNGKPSFLSVGPDGSYDQFATIGGLVGETFLASPKATANGFTAGEVFAANGSKIIRFSAPGAVVAPVEPNGLRLISESFSPPNGRIDPGETVTVEVSLHNIGCSDTANLIATLRASGGVTAPSAAQTFGHLTAQGAEVAKTFSFTANGGLVTATFDLQDGGNNLGPVTFSIPLISPDASSQINVFFGTNPTGSPYPLNITASGLSGTISAVTVSLGDITFPGGSGSLDFLLVSPGGQKVLLMSHCGNYSALNNVYLTFDDSASSFLPSSNGQIVSGTFKPSSYPPVPSFPAPAPAAPYSVALSAFVGGSPNGTWSLYVYIGDDVTASGVIAGGTPITITTTTGRATFPALVASFTYSSTYSINPNVNPSWVTVSGNIGGLFLDEDSRSPFYGSLIAVTDAGSVYRIQSNDAGNSTPFVTLPATGLEGVTVIPDDPKYGDRWRAKIMTASEANNTLYTIDVNHNVLSDNLGSLGLNKAEGFTIIPANQNFFGVKFGPQMLLTAPAKDFANYVGDILIPDEDAGKLYAMRWNNGPQLTLLDDSPGQWEHVTFAPVSVLGLHLSDGVFDSSQNHFSFKINGPNGKQVKVETSTDLTTWTSLGNVTIATTANYYPYVDAASYSVPATGASQSRFYRASTVVNSYYSDNILGFVRIGVPSGFSLIANQLNNFPDNTLPTVLSSAPDQTVIYKFDVNLGAYSSWQYDAGGHTWYSDETATLNPGEGAFISAPSPFTATFIGDVQLCSQLVVPTGFSIVSSVIPKAGYLHDPGAPGDGNTDLSYGIPQTLEVIYQFVNSLNAYNSSQWDGGSWNQGPGPFLNVGEAFFNHSAPAYGTHTWTRCFNVGP